MGRSKFPGKPSKSINRKRISVLQLEDEAGAAASSTATSAAEQQQQQSGEQSAANSASREKGNNCDNDEDDNAPTGGAAIGTGGASTSSSSGGGGGGGASGGNGGGGSSSSNGVNGSKSNDNGHHKSATQNSADPTEDGDDAENKDAAEGGGAGDDDDDSGSETKRPTSSSSSSISAVAPAIAALQRARKGGNKKFKNLNLARAEVMLPSTSRLKQQQQQQQQQQLQLNCPLSSSPATTTTATAPTSPIGNGGGSSIANPFAAIDARVNESGEDVAMKKSSEMPNEGVAEIAATTAATGGTTLPPTTAANSSQAATTAAAAAAGGLTPVTATGATTGTKQKKTVTFRNVLETSDDKSVVKRFYNPDNRMPIVSIMKKDSLNRPLTYSRNSECIVRPSILSKILNKNSNIDKLNSLKFRSAHATSCESLGSGSGSGSSANVFGSGLSRAFGAPLEDDDIEMGGGVTFHRNKSQGPQKNDDDDIEDDEDAEEDAEENEDDHEEIDGSALEKSAEAEATEDKDHPVADEKQLVMDKHFVLPKRTRSSRIIKPNKRLLDDGVIVSKKHPSEANSKTKTKNYFSLQDKPSTGAASSSISTSTTVAFSSFGSLKLNSSFVMRKPRLQFQQIDQTGPFSGITVPAVSFGSSSAATTPPASVSCAVCGTSLNSNEVPQSRKYSVLVCDVCRKFISKMTKKAVSISSSSTAQSGIQQQQLQCKQTEGANCCSINSLKSQLKNFKKLYKDRCTACWLKKCLGTLQLPTAQKNRLSAILPPNMRIEAPAKDDSSVALPTAQSTSSLSTASTSIKWKSGTESSSLNIKSNPLAENNVTFGSSPLLRPAILEKPLFLKDAKVATTTEAISPNAATPSTSESTTTKSSSRHKPKQEKPTRDIESEKPALSPTLKKASTETVAAPELPNDEQLPATTSNPSLPGVPGQNEATEQGASGDNLKRQRIDLKGPRVKHVCRSASIVLGQPLATFGEEEEEQQQQQQQQEQKHEVTPALETLTPAPQMIIDENDNCATCKTPATSTETAPESTKTNKCLANTQPEPGKKTTAKVTTRNAAAAAATVTSVSTLGSMGNKKLNSNTTTSQTITNATSRRSKESLSRQRTLISIDFWENYDPAEVCQTGFGLIVTETVAQRALCFLCGSTGLDPLIFCACCCEPYHQYCVQDEYNLKHSSFEDTTLMNSLLDTSVNPSTGAPSMNQLTQRLNWLCPRCTVCYTCNMSSGSKVKCQKCQKNYHATCLGTSKRLLGADRPLICVNCLKCKSCSTTKVSKFVGNLPMCTACFKLRKKGNYCPICQKCYDDNDFDLKMMECGDCNQWVHSKCEGLSDEQYNLLSTLPESIEFICKKCARRNESSNIKAEEWRQAVMEEFKSSLYSVLKLLSKSRQACALLKLSPRKKLRCICGGAANGNGSSQGKLQPKALQFSGSDGESQNSDDVYEFKDQQVSKSLPLLSKSCSCLQPSITQSQSFSLVDIKQKIAGNTYVSLAEFNYDMSQVIQQSQCDELDIAYKELLSEQFPWFQNETKACTDALEEDMFESCAGGGSYDDLQEDSPSVYAEHSVAQGVARTDVLDIPLDVDVDDLGSCGIKMRLDSRVCLFCRKSGEGLSGEEARLLYCGHDCWVHTNCAMWSAEVFEEIDGSLQNVHSAVARGRMIKCTVCGNRGATVGCNVRSCGEHYHYPCARSIDCAFLTDKTMYCPAHAKNGNALKANGSPSVTYESNFEVSRPVYVELDRKRKKLIEPAKVQFHIGSLEVRQLGSIVPRFSDSFEALIPINFVCSRLYWSSKEPWKIVEYTVRTTIQNSYSSTVIGLDVGRNFTVDHSHTNSNMVLAKIARWHNSLSRNDLLTDTDWAEFPSVPTDDNTEEEPQQNADLLPPEIKDAIFEDLPHDLLDGISMLDIFMYEDLGDKGELFAMSEQSKDGTIAPSQTSQTNNQTVPVSICDEDTRNSSSLGGNCWPASNPVEDAMLSAVRSSNQVQVLKTRAWPKLDGNSVAAIKRRKLSKNIAEGMLLSLSNQQRSKKEMATVAGVSRRQSMSETCTTETASAASSTMRSSNKNFTWSAAKRYFEKSEPREETAKMRIMQMDGVDDSITEFRIVGGDGNLSTAQFTGQVKCERCQCTYRNYESFQRHLPSCEPMSTSESESEATNTPSVTHLSAESFNEALQKQALAAATLGNAGGINYLQTTSYPQVQNLGTLGQFGLQGLQPLQLQPQSLGNGFFLSQANHNPTATTGSDDLQLYANSLQSLAANLGGGFALTQPTVATSAQPQLIAVSTNPDGTQQFIQLPQTTPAPQAATYQTLQATNTDKKIMLPLTTAAKPLKTVATKAGQQATAAAKQKQLKSAHQVKPIQAKLQPHPQQQSHPQQQQPITATATATQLLGQSLLQPQLLFQSNAQAQAPQLILPQTQPQNIISFVTGDGSQAQPLQYISIPTTNDFKHQQATATPTFLTTATPGAGATFLQTDASGNLMLTTTPTNSGLQMLAAPMQAQPQVIGTLIQPQTLQLAATTTGATGGDGTQNHPHASGQQSLILGGTAGGGATGLEFATTTPQVILATQPMYYGLETIVQNTVMSSQQFVSTAMPGVLSQNASFSATTTQVFQASKIEPIVDLPAGYVVLNNPNGDGSAGTFLNAANVLQQQQQQHTQEEATTTTQLLQNANFQFQTVPTSATTTTSMADFATSSPLVVTAKIPPVTQMKRKTAAAATGVTAAGHTGTTMPGMNKMMQPQVVNKVLPTSIATSHHAQVKQNNANLRQTMGSSTLKTKHTPGSNCGAPPSIASKPLQKKTNLIRPIHKVEVKPKVMKPMPKLNNPVGSVTTLTTQPQHPHPHPHTLPIVSQVVQQRLPATIPQLPQQQPQQQQQQQLPVQISIPEAQQMQQQLALETQEPGTELVNRVQHFVSSSLPTNVVNPLQQQPATLTTSSRPTNRVLPMQQRQEPPVPLINDTVVPSSPTPPKPIEQPIIVSSVSSASKCYAPKASPSTVYETELKTTDTVPPSTITAINTMLEHPQEQIITESFYEKQPPAQPQSEDKCNVLMLPVQQPPTHLEIVDNGFLMEKHGFQMETEPLPIESNEHFASLKDSVDMDRVDEEDDDDDFSLKMATSACQDHEMSDSEEPAVKEKISKILDNLTNDDCADSIATATTAEVESSAGYQQMVEDVLATTAAAAAASSSSSSAVTVASATTNEEFEATAEETAAVEAAASYINEMAEAHVLELKQLQTGVELELKKDSPSPPSKQAEQNQSNEQPTAAPPEPPPPIREPRKISGPHLLYEIQSEDGFIYKSSSIAEIWEKVFEAVQVARRAHGLTQLPEGPLADMGGIQMIGLKTNALKYLIEQLPGVEKCSKYTPKYHKRNGNVSTAGSSGHLGSNGVGSTSAGDNQPLLDYGSDQDELQENAYDCARCEPYATRSEYDMFSWLASRHRKQPIQVFVQPSDNELVPRRGTGSNLPMAMKYRTLKETYKDYVGVFRSHIHGRGLYCTKDIEAGEMVIEYAGELIRSTLTDKRERYYDSRGIGCYMFKIDDNLVVDATMRGNAARFINHSCEPNCYSKVVDILGHKHIIIFALRRIVQGEELTYDYKFPFEEEKIPCSCGSKRCRKYLN